MAEKANVRTSSQIEPMTETEAQVSQIEVDTSPGSGQETEEEITDEHTYPEGGREAWLVTFGAWCAMVPALGLTNTVGALQAYVSTNQLREYDEGTVSWIFSIYLFIVFFCGLQVGPVFDAKGPRVLMILGSALLVTGIMLLSICTKQQPAYWQFVVGFSLPAGLGSSLLFNPALSSISHFFMKKRANATGIAMTGGAIGGVIFPLVLRGLFPVVGWQWSVRITGFIFLFFCVLSNFLVHARLPPKPKTSFADVIPDFRIYLDGNGAFAIVTAGVFFMEYGVFVPLAYITSFSLKQGINSSLSYYFNSILMAGSVVGRWAPGYAADRLGRFNIMIVCLVLCMAATFGLWLPAVFVSETSVMPLVLTYAVVYGFTSGSNLGLTPTCVGQLCETRHYGRYFTTCYTIVSFSTLTGIPLAGSLINACGGSFWGLIVFAGLSYAASTICFVWARIIKVGWSWKAVF